MVNLLNLLETRRNEPEYTPSGPLIIVPPSSGKKSETIYLLHELILAPFPSLRMAAIKNILEDVDVSRVSKQFIEKKAKDIESDVHNIWYPAANEASYTLQKDFFYSQRLFREVMYISPPNKQFIDISPPNKELIDFAQKHIFTPNLDSVLSDLPVLLNGSLIQESIKQRIEEGISTKMLGKLELYPETLKDILEWYMENIYFVPVTYPFNPWKVISKQLRLCEEAGLSGTTIFHALKEWLNSSEDLLAYLVALEMILNVSCRAQKEKKGEQNFFIGSDFFEFLDNLFNTLLSSTEEDSWQNSNYVHKKRQVAWRMKITMSRYFLRYIDLNDKRAIDDEKKVGMAWWMAKKLSTSVFHACRKLIVQDQITFIEEIEKDFKKRDDRIGLPHLFLDQRGWYSLARYSTLYDRDLLSLAALAIIMPNENYNSDECTAFKGLKEPTALSPEIRDKIINKLIIPALHGDGQIPKDKKNQLPLSWNISLCFSIPTLFRAYYGDAIDFLGEEKMQIIKFAEAVSDPRYLETELVTLPQFIKNQEMHRVAGALASLKIFIFIQGKIPDGADIFKKNEALARDISQTDNDKLGRFCLTTLVHILGRLQASGNIKWSEIIGNLFRQIDYSKCSDSIVRDLVPDLFGVVLLGADYSLLQPIFEVKVSDKRIRQALKFVKEGLEHNFPYIPGIYKENVRKALNDLEDIPTSE